MRPRLLPVGRRPRSWSAAAAAAGLVAAGVTLTPLSTSAAPGGRSPFSPASPSSFVRAFEAAKPATGAMFRWWWPSSVRPDVAVQQLREVAAKGYKGVEIAFVMDGTDYVVDPDVYEYGDANWRASVKAVLAEANKIGIRVDLTLGGRWPAAIPGLDVSSNAASQELATGSAVVAADETLDADVPPPPQRTYEDRTSENGTVTTTTQVSQPTYVTTTASRCVTDCSGPTPQIDLTTVRDISDAVTNGHLSWTAPAEGTWIVTGYWQRGTAQRNDAPFGSTVSPLSDPESRVINHFSVEGTDRFIRYFKGLLDPETRRLLRANGGSFFEDSLELTFTQAWTPEFVDAFEETNGYSVLPYLPTLARNIPAQGPFGGGPTPVYSYADGQDQIAERVNWDVERTLNALYIENHVTPITEWAHSLGLTFRAQPYGEPIDLGGAARALDVSECETLGCSEAQFRTMAPAVARARKQLVSSEMLPGELTLDGPGGPTIGQIYAQTQAQITARVNREYAFGANQMVFHGLPYELIPPSADGTITDDAAHWPGFEAFGAQIAEAFGPRQPSWAMQRDTSAYYTRTQQVLQSGSPTYDVAVLNQTLSGGVATRDAAFLGAAGYAYGYLTPGSLSGAPVSGGVLDPAGPAFQALVVDSAPTDLSTALEIQRVAYAGLPVIVIDGGAQHARGYSASAGDAATEDRAVRRAFDRVAGAPNSYDVTGNEEALSVLSGLGVTKDAILGDAAVTAVHRKTERTDLYVLINRSDQAVTTTASLAGRRAAVPYRLNPWTGQVTPAGVYTRSRRHTVLSVTLPPGGSAIVALASRAFAGRTVPGRHVVTTTATDARWAKDTLILNANTNGRFSSRLSNGRILRTHVTGVPRARNLAHWSLRLDEWLPGESGDASNVTRHQIDKINDVPLESWTEIPGITDAVGVGTYTTKLKVGSRFAGARAVVDLGAVAGAYRVYVNGKRVATPDQLGAVVDLGAALKPGTNTVSVEVASPLLNRLRVHRPDEFGARPPTVNGLLGPVTLDPYRVVRD